MGKNGLKDSFISENKLHIALLGDYLTKDVGISNIDSYTMNDGIENMYHSDKYVIQVPERSYEQALIRGQEFVVRKKFEEISRIDYKGNIGTCKQLKIGYGIIKEAVNKRADLWCNYRLYHGEKWFATLQNYLETGPIYKEYDKPNDAVFIFTEQMDYHHQIMLLDRFIECCGTGPFEVLKPVSISGEVKESEDFPKLIKKSKHF